MFWRCSSSMCGRLACTWGKWENVGDPDLERPRVNSRKSGKMNFCAWHTAGPDGPGWNYTGGCAVTWRLPWNISKGKSSLIFPWSFLKLFSGPYKHILIKEFEVEPCSHPNPPTKNGRKKQTEEARFLYMELEVFSCFPFASSKRLFGF